MTWFPPEQEWYYDDEAKVHYYEDGHYWFESRSVDVCQPIEDTPLGTNINIQFSIEIDVKSTGSRIRIRYTVYYSVTGILGCNREILVSCAMLLICLRSFHITN
jgi:hypothetical protein